MKRITLSITLVLALTLSLFSQDTNVNIRKIGGTVIGDPCQTTAPTTLEINQSATGPLTIVTGVAAKKIYICSMFIISTSEQSVNLLEGTGANCGASVIRGLFGGTSAGTGPSLIAHSGWTLGSGEHRVQMTKTSGTNLCLASSSTGRINGTINYVQR